jgi:RES domain-containing protein
MKTTTSYNGTLFRCIPNASTAPLSSQYSVSSGGRWNAQGTYPVLYTFLSQGTARDWLSISYANAGVSPADLEPSRLPDLVVLDGSYDNVANLTTEEGLTEVGLPSTYPVGYTTTAAWSVTQPVGANICSQGHTAILTCSASASSWDGPLENWAELAIFTDNAPAPRLVDRLPYDDWA